MTIQNNTDEPLIAFAWDTRYGYGMDTTIEPGKKKELIGPYMVTFGA